MPNAVSIPVRVDDKASGPIKDINDAFKRLSNDGVGSLAKSLGPSVFGAAASVGFGLATKGLLDLDNATQQYRATTGATQSDVAAMQQTVLELNKHNLEGIGEITSVVATLRTNLGLTQQGADDATQSFLDYAKATGQDSTQSTEALSTVLKAWNLTANDAQGVMDQLVVSHQKYGGSIEANQQALSDLAPALQAANASIDDGIGFLNASAKAGIDAGSATAGLSRAVKQLKPGQTLDDLVKQISSIEDPTVRAQTAMQLFGKSGAKFAEVFKPGVDSLKQYEVTAGDAADATKKAAEDIDGSIENQIQLAFKNLGGTLLEFAAPAGPLLTALGGLASATPMLVEFAGGIKNLPNIIRSGWALAGTATTAAAGALGAAAGTVYGAAVGAGHWVTDAVKGLWTTAATEGVAEATAAGTADGVAYAAGIKAGLVASAKNLVTDLIGSLKSGLSSGGGLSLVNYHDLDKQVGDAYDAAHGGFLKIEGDAQHAATVVDGATKSMGASLADVGTAAIQSGTDADDAQLGIQHLASSYTLAEQNTLQWWKTSIHAFGDLAGAAPATEGAITGVVTAVTTGLAGIHTAAANAGADAMDALATSIEANRQKPVDEMQKLHDALLHPLSETAETTRLLGELASKDLAEGLASGDANARTIARASQQSILDELAKLKPGAGTIGKEGMDFLKEAMKSKNKDIATAAQGIYDAAIGKGSPLSKMPGTAKTIGAATTTDMGGGLSSGITTHVTPAVNTGVKEVGKLAIPGATTHQWGYNIGSSWGEGMVGGINAHTEDVKTAAANMTLSIKGNSPPAVGPLKDIDKWGRNVGMAWVDAFIKALETAGDKAKLTLKGVQAAVQDAIKDYGGLVFPSATPANQAADLQKYIASDKAKLATTIDPKERAALEAEIADYTSRLADLTGKAATADQETLDKLSGYITNLDRALLTDTDPTKYAKDYAELIHYQQERDALIAQMGTDATNAANAAKPPTAQDQQNAAAQAKLDALALQKIGLQRQLDALSLTDEMKTQNAVAITALQKQIDTVQAQEDAINAAKQQVQLTSDYADQLKIAGASAQAITDALNAAIAAQTALNSLTGGGGGTSSTTGTGVQTSPNVYPNGAISKVVMADGTIVWTYPDGHKTTEPGPAPAGGPTFQRGPDWYGQQGGANANVAGGPAGGIHIEQIVVNNPTAEPAGTSVSRNLRTLAYLGGHSS